MSEEREEYEVSRELWEREKLSELAVDLAKAQGELENATKSSENPFFKSKYADLAEILNTVRPVFSKHGLSFVQFPEMTDKIVTVKTLLLHKGGGSLESSLSAPLGGKQDAQAIGASITYLRRYSLASIAGVAQEDDDGNSNQRVEPVIISKQQASVIYDLISDTKTNSKELCHYYSVDSVVHLPSELYSKIVNQLKSKKLKQIAKDEHGRTDAETTEAPDQDEDKK